VWSQAKAAYASLVLRRAEARRKLRWRIAGLGAIGAVAVAVVLLIPGSQEVAKPIPELAEPVDLVPKPAAVPPAAPTSAPRAMWSLPFAIELLSSTMRSAAFASGDDLEHAGIPSLVSPVRIGRRIWYRVYAGPVATSGSADSLMDAVRRAGLGSFNSAKAVRVPLSFAVAQAADSAAARDVRARLRRAGIAAFVLGRADGGYQVFAGAFATRSEATYLGSALRAARSPGVLGPRVGRRP
jgi:cell division septation protein DedD